MIQPNTIVCGDCLQVMKDIPDGSVDCIICDLPYGTTACKWDSVIPFEPLWEQYKRVIKKGGHVVLFGAEPFSSMVRMSNLDWYKYDWIWKKTKAVGFMNAKNTPLRDYENICVFCDGASKYNPQGLIRKTSHNSRPSFKADNIYGKRKEFADSEYVNYPKQVIEFANPSGAGHLHPTQKPVDLIAYLIRTYSNPGDTILDNTMGSGTTCVAAIREKRRYIGIEMNEQYFQAAQQRINNELSQPTLF